MFKDISGVPLNIGDKVVVQYKQLFRIGIITGFTDKKIIVGFNFSVLNPEELEYVKLNPWKVAKVINQNIGLQDYYKYIKK